MAPQHTKTFFIKAECKHLPRNIKTRNEISNIIFCKNVVENIAQPKVNTIRHKPNNSIKYKIKTIICMFKKH